MIFTKTNPKPVDNEPTEYEYTLFNFSKDQHRRWRLVYERNGVRCSRFILDSSGLHVDFRFPLGLEVIQTVRELIGRNLNQQEEEFILALPVIR